MYLAGSGTPRTLCMPGASNVSTYLSANSTALKPAAHVTPSALRARGWGGTVEDEAFGVP